MEGDGGEPLSRLLVDRLRLPSPDPTLGGGGGDAVPDSLVPDSLVPDSPWHPLGDPSDDALGEEKESTGRGKEEKGDAGGGGQQEHRG